MGRRASSGVISSGDVGNLSMPPKTGGGGLTHVGGEVLLKSFFNT